MHTPGLFAVIGGQHSSRAHTVSVGSERFIFFYTPPSPPPCYPPPTTTHVLIRWVEKEGEVRSKKQGEYEQGIGEILHVKVENFASDITTNPVLIPLLTYQLLCEQETVDRGETQPKPGGPTRSRADEI